MKIFGSRGCILHSLSLQNTSAWHCNMCISPAASSFKLWRSNNDHRVVLWIGFENSNSHVVQLGGNLGTIITIYINCGPASRFWKIIFAWFWNLSSVPRPNVWSQLMLGRTIQFQFFFFGSFRQGFSELTAFLGDSTNHILDFFFFFSVLGFFFKKSRWIFF